MGRKSWMGREGRPPFNVGDVIVPNHNYDYRGNHRWMETEPRKVERVYHWDSTDNWTLSVYNPSLDKLSEYNPHNFRVLTPAGRNESMAERAKHYGIQFDSDGSIIDRTDAYDSLHQARLCIAQRIRTGEVWMIMKGEMRLEGKPKSTVDVIETQYV